MRLPAYSGDAQLQNMFRLVDEQISELYSIHGEMKYRGAMALGSEKGTETTGKVYSESVAKAWVYYNTQTGNILRSYNVSDVTAVPPFAGINVIKFATPMNSDKYVAIGVGDFTGLGDAYVVNFFGRTTGQVGAWTFNAIVGGIGNTNVSCIFYE